MAASIASVLEAERILETLTASESESATLHQTFENGVEVRHLDSVADAITALANLSSSKKLSAIERVQTWELATEIYQKGGYDSLKQAAKASGCSVLVLKRWVKRLQNLQRMYPTLSADIFEEAYRIIWYFPKRAPEHNVRFWLDLAQSREWSRNQLTRAMLTRNAGRGVLDSTSANSHRYLLNLPSLASNEIIPRIKQYYQENGCWPRSRDWETWQSDHPDAPTLMQIRHLYGSWNNALLSAGASVRVRRPRKLPVHRSLAYLSIVAHQYRREYSKWPRYSDWIRWRHDSISHVVYPRYQSWSQFIERVRVFHLFWSRRWHVNPSRLKPDLSHDVEPVSSDTVDNAIATLTTLRSRNRLGRNDRWHHWELASAIFQENGRDGLFRASRVSGYSESSLVRWAKTLSRFSPELRRGYPDLPTRIFEEAYQAAKLFSAEDPEHDLRFWLELAQTHHWNCERLIYEAKTIQQKRVAASAESNSRLTIKQDRAFRPNWTRRWRVIRNVPSIETSSSPSALPAANSSPATFDVPVPDAFASAVRSWRLLATESLSLADRGELAIAFQQSLMEAIAVFNTCWSPYFLQEINLTYHPLFLD